MAKTSLPNNPDNLQFAPLSTHVRFMNLANHIYGRLCVAGYAGGRYWFCKCICGNTIKVRNSHLRKGHTRSCGCLAKETVTTHGETLNGVWSREYRSYMSAKERCQNPKSSKYQYYGGRGIEFRFTAFEQFLAEVGRRPTKEHSIDRIDNDGHYEPGNIKWSTRSEQRQNRRQAVRTGGKDNAPR